MGSFQWVPLRGGETRGERPRKLGPQERFFPRNPGGSQPCWCPPGGVDLPQDGGHQCGARRGSLGRGLVLRRPVCSPQLVAHTPSARSFASPPWPFRSFHSLVSTPTCFTSESGSGDSKATDIWKIITAQGREWSSRQGPGPRARAWEGSRGAELGPALGHLHPSSPGPGGPHGALQSSRSCPGSISASLRDPHPSPLPRCPHGLKARRVLPPT